MNCFAQNYNLPNSQELFTSLDITPDLARGITILHELSSLGYISSDQEMSITNEGIEYMLKNHREFIENVKGKDMDFGIFQSSVDSMIQKSRLGLGTETITHRFYMENTSLFYQ